VERSGAGSLGGGGGGDFCVCDWWGPAPPGGAPGGGRGHARLNAYTPESGPKCPSQQHTTVLRTSVSSSLHSGIEIGRRRTGKGLRGG
jgi:hypothetical protein